MFGDRIESEEPWITGLILIRAQHRHNVLFILGPRSLKERKRIESLAFGEQGGLNSNAERKRLKRTGLLGRASYKNTTYLGRGGIRSEHKLYRSGKQLAQSVVVTARQQSSQEGGTDVAHGTATRGEYPSLLDHIFQKDGRCEGCSRLTCVQKDKC